MASSPALAGGRIRPGLSARQPPRVPHPILGSRHAKVTVVIWGDLQCPFSRRFMGALQQVIKAYPRDVKIVWRDFPLRFHRQAMPAAVVGREVFRQKGSKAYFKYQAQVFANYRSITPANLQTWAGQAGADTAKVAAALASMKGKSAIEADMLAAQQQGVRGTPTWFVNNHRQVGARQYSAVKQVIDAALGRP